MGDEFTSLIEKYRNDPNEMEGIFIYQQEPVHNQEQFMQGLLANSDNLANNMLSQSQQQTAEAINAKNAMLAKQDALEQQTMQQGAQLAEQERQRQQQGGLLGKIAMSYLTGGLNNAIGGALGNVFGGAVGGSAGNVYPGGWLV